MDGVIDRGWWGKEGGGRGEGRYTDDIGRQLPQIGEYNFSFLRELFMYVCLLAVNKLQNHTNKV